jgi:hypothetical protein
MHEFIKVGLHSDRKKSTIRLVDDGDGTSETVSSIGKECEKYQAGRCIFSVVEG